uniref:Putative ovule protein n=1 Tax=Solanum chacoense TaxID=4108 RepID=A0A0V0GJF4_SOLCH
MSAINYFPCLTIRIERLLSVSVHFNSPILCANFFCRSIQRDTHSVMKAFSQGFLMPCVTSLKRELQ